MTKRLTTEEFIAKAMKVHNGRYSYADAVYVDKKTQLIVTCKEHGNRLVTPAVHLQGRMLNCCAGAARKGIKRINQTPEKIARQVAKQNGQMFFYGAICSNCGCNKRYVCNNSCADCAVESRKKSNAKNYGQRRKHLKQSEIYRDDKQVSSWLKEIYASKKAMQEQFGIPLDIDHVVPINGVDVCGLHVPWNLRITTSKFNRSKQNSMEEDLCDPPAYGTVAIHQSALPWNLKGVNHDNRV